MFESIHITFMGFPEFLVFIEECYMGRGLRCPECRACYSGGLRIMSMRRHIGIIESLFLAIPHLHLQKTLCFSANVPGAPAVQVDDAKTRKALALSALNPKPQTLKPKHPEA